MFWRVFLFMFCLILSFSFYYHMDLYLNSRILALSPGTQCEAKNRVMFLKTHKTASSTVQNLLFRYADSRSLTVALPVGQQFSFNYPFPFHRSSVEGVKDQEQDFHILCSHLRFNATEVKAIMRSNDAFYFSILRDPVTLMQSSYYYYRTEYPAFKSSPSLEGFLQDPWEYYDPTERYNNNVRNVMWHDFGYDSNGEISESYFTGSLREIEASFHLILIAEYFDESMILLKDALCWDIDDVVSFEMNKRKMNKSQVQSLDKDMIQRIKAWNALDVSLYSYFNRTFWAKVEQQIGSSRMKEEVALLRARRRQLREECLVGNGLIDGEAIKDKYLQPWKLNDILGYDLRSDLPSKKRTKCLRYFMTELPYTAMLYARQYPHKPPKKI